MVITVIVTCDASVLDKNHRKRYNIINKFWNNIKKYLIINILKRITYYD
jgi:hypothetical protein